jgi:putative oxidoreductase
MTNVFLRIYRQLDRVPLDLLLLAARIAVAVVFFRSGLTKIASWDTTIALFRNEYALPLIPPEIAAPLAAANELGMSTLLAIGLFTRVATLPLLGMVFVIQTLVYPENWPEHLTWATLLLLILTRGPGIVSLDALLSYGLFRRQAA